MNRQDIVAFLEKAIKLTESVVALHYEGQVLADSLPEISASYTTNSRTVPLHSGESTASEFSAISYAAPEQSGKTGYRSDHRSDLYKLGIILYEMAGGFLPFSNSDPLEVVSQHLSIEPEPLVIKNLSIPSYVSDIIHHLLAKRPEERYLSSAQLLSDLQYCLEYVQNRSNPLETEPPNWRIMQLNLSHHGIYGRESELCTITAAWQRVAAGSCEFMCVEGKAGVGKTALINSARDLVEKQGGVFISGKFDQYHLGNPYIAIADAFKEYVHNILLQQEEEILQWRRRLKRALGDSGWIIAELLPEIKYILGSPQGTHSIGHPEAKNIFHRVFLEFVRGFATPQKPLCLFIDDIQWADMASLELLHLLVGNSNIPGLLLITAFRGEDMPEENRAFIQELCSDGSVISTTLLLSPLDSLSMRSLVLESLCCSQKEAGKVLPFLVQSARGNPFHLLQFVRLTVSWGVMTWNMKDGYWVLDIPACASFGDIGRSIVSDVLRIIYIRIGLLPTQTSKLLNHAASLGLRFSTAHLAIIAGRAEDELHTILQPALDEAVIEHIEDGYRFVHDRIRQVLYLQLENEHRLSLHVRNAKRLIAATPDYLDSEILFLVADQLNLGRRVILEHDEIIELARINLAAGLKAVKTAAFSAALKYFSAGLELLSEDGWSEHYDLMLHLNEEVAAAAFMCGDYVLMEQCLCSILQNANDILDKIRCHELCIQAEYARDDLASAIDIALKVLEELGFHFPRIPSKMHVLIWLLRLKFRLRGKQVRNLEHLPQMTSRRALSALRILSATACAVYTSSPMLMPLFIIMGVNISLKYGNGPQSCFMYATFGFLLCGAGDVSAGLEFGKLAQRLLKDEASFSERAKTIFVNECFIMPWHLHIRNSLLRLKLKEGYRAGLESGDFEFALRNLSQIYYFSFFMGVNLQRVHDGFKRCASELTYTKQVPPLRLIKLYFQACMEFIDSSATSLLAKDLGHEIFEEFNENDVNFMANFYALKLIYHYLFYQPRKALACSNALRKYITGVTGQILVPQFFFYDSLSRLALYADCNSGQQTKILWKVRTGQKMMKRWAEAAPENYLHKWHLVEAETARVRGDANRAEHHYKNAVELSLKNGFCQEHGLSCELAALFYLHNEDRKKAKEFLSQAWKSYDRWGAGAKLKAMEKRYGKLLSKKKHAETPSKPPISLDMLALLKASQTISSEVNPEYLPAKIMHILYTFSGASRGVMLREDEKGHFYPCGQIVKGSFEPASLPEHGMKTKKGCDVPWSVITFVSRTGKTVILDNAQTSDLFGKDDYVKKSGVKSVCCLPMRHHSKLTGMIYLENNLLDKAFSNQDKELLQLLSAQAAISLQNASLIENLTELNRKLITENRKRIHTEKILRRSEKQYRLLAENVTDVIWTMDLDKNFTYVSPSVSRLLGFSPEEIMEYGMEMVMTPDELQKAENVIDWELEKERQGKLDEFHLVSFDLELVKKDGCPIWLESRMTFLRNHKGEVTGIVGVTRDISKRKQAEEELDRSRQELRELSRHMQEQWEQDMAVLARDIHDELGQSLTALNMELAWLSAHKELDNEKIALKIASMQSVVKDTISSVKRISTGLRPSVLDHFGLSAAVEWHVAEFSKWTGIKCSVNVPHGEVGLNKARSIAIFRILQESLTNVSRHAEATSVEITLEQDESVVKLLIRDNGCGFDTGKADSKLNSFGLVSMRERAQAHNGILEVTSTPGQGTVIEASFQN